VRGLSLVLTAALSLTAAAEEFREGDRVAFVGDSITHMGQYVRFIADYYLTRFPDRDIRFFKIGRCGNTLKHCQRWYGPEVAAKRPNVVSVMFGMNDIDRKLYSDETPDETWRQQRTRLADYAENLSKLDALIDAQSNSPRRYYLTPTPYFDMADKPAKVEQHVGANAALGEAAGQVRAACARHGGTLVDLNAAFNAYMRRWTGPDDRFITGWDRVHPQEGGHLLMAWTFLRAQNVTPVVSDVRIQGGRAVCAANAEVTDLAARADGGVSFTCHAKSLPMPVLSLGTVKALADLPIADELNQEILSFYAPADGEWTLAIDGQDVLTTDAKAWRVGVNLAFNDKTPQYAQAQRVAEANREHFKSDREAEGDFSRLRALARPVPHRYELRRR